MRDIPGYEGLYAATSCGKIWSYKSEKFLKPRNHQDGYLLITLSKQGKATTYVVHRLIAQTYIPNPENKPQVNHKDENKQNNCVNNLEWVTISENVNYGTRSSRAGKTIGKPVYCVELDKTFDTLTAAAQELGMSAASISRCCKGRTETYGGYHWQFAQREDK